MQEMKIRISTNWGQGSPRKCFWSSDRFAVVQFGGHISLIHRPSGGAVCYDYQVEGDSMSIPSDLLENIVADRLTKVGQTLDSVRLWQVFDRASFGHGLQCLPADLKKRLQDSIKAAIKQAMEEVK